MLCPNIWPCFLPNASITDIASIMGPKCVYLFPTNFHRVQGSKDCSQVRFKTIQKASKKILVAPCLFHGHIAIHEMSMETHQKASLEWVLWNAYLFTMSYFPVNMFRTLSSTCFYVLFTCFMSFPDALCFCFCQVHVAQSTWKWPAKIFRKSPALSQALKASLSI